MRHRIRRLAERYLNWAARYSTPFRQGKRMSARRCSRCGIDWPEHDDYTHCPECESKTWVSQSAQALDHAEANSRRNHALFERFYADRERRHLEAAAQEIAALPEHKTVAS